MSTETPTHPADRSGSLREVAYQRLREQIVQCEIAPGARLSERRLAAEFDVGTSTIRAALARLDTDGLVRTRPRSGYEVTPITLASLESLFGAWEVVMAGISELATRRATDTELRELANRVHETSARCEAPAHPLTWLDEAEAHVLASARIARSPHLEMIFQRLHYEMRRAYGLVLRTNPQPFLEQFASESPFAAEAILNRNIAEVRRHAVTVTRTAYDLLRAIITQSPSIMDVAIERG